MKAVLDKALGEDASHDFDKIDQTGWGWFFFIVSFCLFCLCSFLFVCSFFCLFVLFFVCLFVIFSKHFWSLKWKFKNWAGILQLKKSRRIKVEHYLLNWRELGVEHWPIPWVTFQLFLEWCLNIWYRQSSRNGRPIIAEGFWGFECILDGTIADIFDIVTSFCT